MPDKRTAAEVFAFENGQRVFLRVTAVDGDRNVQFSGKAELGAEYRFLYVVRRAFRIGPRIIQAYFTDGADARVFQDVGPDKSECLLTERTRVIRVNAQEEEDLRVIPEKFRVPGKFGGIEEDVGDTGDAALPGPLQDFSEVSAESRIVQVGVRIDTSGGKSAGERINTRRFLMFGHICASALLLSV